MLTTNVDKKALLATKFPPEFKNKVDTTKVSKDVINKWIADKLASISTDDEILAGMVANMIDEQYPKIKELQIQITGFLGKKAAAAFSQELWNLLLSAQDTVNGVPPELLEAKKAEIEQQRREADKIAEERRAQREAEDRRKGDLDRVRGREHDDRNARRGGRDNRRDNGYGGRRPSYHDRSSPAIHDDRRRPPPSRGMDSYVPGDSMRRSPADMSRNERAYPPQSRNYERRDSSSFESDGSRNYRSDRGHPQQRRGDYGRRRSRSPLRHSHRRSDDRSASPDARHRKHNGETNAKRRNYKQEAGKDTKEDTSKQEFTKHEATKQEAIEQEVNKQEVTEQKVTKLDIEQQDSKQEEAKP